MRLLSLSVMAAMFIHSIRLSIEWEQQVMPKGIFLFRN